MDNAPARANPRGVKLDSWAAHLDSGGSTSYLHQMTSGERFIFVFGGSVCK